MMDGPITGTGPREPAASSQQPVISEAVLPAHSPLVMGRGGNDRNEAGKPDGSLVKVQLHQGEVTAVMNRAESPLINTDKLSSDVSSGKE